MEAKDYVYLILIGVILIGGVTYTVYETGEEITCRTNKPIGWNILEEYDGYFKAVCPFKTKEPVEAYCSEFRSTGSYQRYGCKEVILIEESPQKQVKEPWGDSYNCYPDGCEI